MVFFSILPTQSVREPFSYPCLTVFALTVDQRARVVNVGENHTRSAEDTCFQLDIVIDRNAILDLTAVANNNLIADKYILIKRNTFADVDPDTNMCPVPDSRALADLCSFVDDSRFMNGIYPHVGAPRSIPDVLVGRDIPPLFKRVSTWAISVK